MVPTNLNFGPSQVKTVRNPNRNRYSKIFCETYCVRLTISIPGTIENCSLEREHPFLTEFVLIVNSCFIQYNLPLVESVNVARKKKLFGQE